MENGNKPLTAEEKIDDFIEGWLNALIKGYSDIDQKILIRDKMKKELCDVIEVFSNQPKPVVSDGDKPHYYKIVLDILEGMDGIGGIPLAEEFYAEFDFRLRAKLSLPLQPKQTVVSDMRSLLDGFYSWLDDLTQDEFDNMSLTEQCEAYFIGKGLSLQSDGKGSDAVEFAQWIGNNMYVKHQKDLWVSLKAEGDFSDLLFSTQELYELFTQSKNQK